MARTTTRLSNPLRALVLDGDAASRHALVRSLEGRSFSVSAAADGARGLELLLEELLSLDVVVIDAELPHRDALGFAELVRRAGGERDLAIVVVARAAAPALRAALLALDVDAVVERSHGPDAAAAAAARAIAARGARALEVEDAPEPERSAVAPRFELPLAAGWSLLAAC